MQFNNKNKPKGIKRLNLALGHSCRAIHWLAKNESAFRQELLLLGITAIIVLALEVSCYEGVMMICATMFVIFAEVLNSAIEVIIDRVSLEIHPLSGLAKDLGSAAVLIALLILMCIWGSVIYTNI